MFRPRDSHDLLLASSFEVPPRASVRWTYDIFSKPISIFEFEEEVPELRLESRVRVAHYGLDEPDYPIEHGAETYPFTYAENDLIDLGHTRERHYPETRTAASRPGRAASPCRAAPPWSSWPG